MSPADIHLIGNSTYEPHTVKVFCGETFVPYDRAIHAVLTKRATCPACLIAHAAYVLLVEVELAR